MVYTLLENLLCCSSLLLQTRVHVPDFVVCSLPARGADRAVCLPAHQLTCSFLLLMSPASLMLQAMEHSRRLPALLLMAVATSFGVSARSHKLVRHDGRLAAKHACKDHWQWDVGDLPHHSATASMVPAFVTLDGVQIGHPVVDGVSDQDACDQIAAIGVADGIVRGVSHHISKGFSLGIVGTGGEMIEFRLAL